MSTFLCDLDVFFIENMIVQQSKTNMILVSRRLFNFSDRIFHKMHYAIFYISSIK